MPGSGPKHDATQGMTIPGFTLAERVHESPLRVVFRATRDADGEQVILKTLLAQYPRKREVAELRREYQIARKLSFEGIIRVHSLVSHGAGNLAIEMEPFGLSLADLLARRDGQPLRLDRFFAVAVRLAEILGRLHERDVIHKDVVPRNVLIDPATNELRLIDFGISSELSRERQRVVLSQRLEGSLPYISPEQTGRMNRDLDYRTDYYSLGATFFELLTGSLPFSATTALEWVHRHISQAPAAAHDLRAEVPEPLSQIVSKLMSKSVDDRYQSTFGLIADLERCRADLLRAGSVTPFELGLSDVSRRFQIPQKLYGREAELAQLRGMFDDVAHGRTGLCLVSGEAGVGKSALVNELSKSIVGKKGYLVQGKFDQLQKSSAYGAFALAFRGLMPQLLGESDKRLDRWRAALREALGPNGQLMVALVPELELVIGAQPPVPELPPTEAQNRFQLVFMRFVKVFANARHPLVIFIDDLHWSDVPTLNLIQRLVTARELSHLFVVGAYRGKEVHAGHRLRMTLNEIEKVRELVELRLQPLEREAVIRLTADTVRTDVARARPLADLLYDKARGNPFFVNELLKSLGEAGAISFDPEAGRWDWDLEAVRRAELGDNVVEFMVANLRRLGASTQQVLQLAACIGNTFDLKTLSIIYERSMEETGAELYEALKRNMLAPLSDSYMLVGTGAAWEDDGDSVNPTYRFQHDRVQQAAYALIDPDRKQGVHLSIGRLIQLHSSDQELEERLIDIVGHLNAGRRLMVDASARRGLARLNLRAGVKAHRSSAYESALAFLRVGREILPDDAWDTDYDLLLALSTEYQKCAYLTGDHEQAETWTDAMLAHARTPLEKAEILSARTRQYATVGKMRESIDAAMKGLSLLGIEFFDDPGPEAIAREVAAVQRNLRGRPIPELIDAPALVARTEGVAIGLLMEIFPAAFLSGSGDLFPYLVLKAVNISLRHGNSPESAFAYAAYGMLLCGALDDPALGYEYGKLAVAMNEQLADIALKSRVIYVYTMFIHHWSEHWSSMTPWFRKGIEAGYQSGDLLYLAYSAQDCIIWDPRLDLDTASEEQRRYLSIVADCEYQDSLDSGTLFLQMQLNFQGLTESRYSMSDGAFDEALCVEGMRARHFMTGVANYHIYKAEIHLFYGDHVGALVHVVAQEALIASSMSLPQLVRFHIVSFLTRAALCPEMDPAEQETARARMNADLGKMSTWADHCPVNFEHLRLLMQAERASLAGSMQEALQLYEQSIAAAATAEFRRDEAMASELAGRCLLRLGLGTAADGYLRAARYLYYRWGAARKVEQLEETYPHLREHTDSARSGESPSLTRTHTHSTSSATDSINFSALDMSSVMKASQAISGEIVLGRLWRTTMQILLENAGGQRGWFVVREGDRLVVEARGSSTEGDAEGGADDDGAPPEVLTDEHPTLPISIINNVLRTGKPLVLADASRSAQFASDPYIVSEQPKSVFCVPLRHRGRFEGAIYMENNLTSGAFTEERVEVIKLLSAQAAISTENARLYQEQTRLIEAQRRFVPSQFLDSLGRHDIAEVGPGEYVAREMSVLFADLRDFTPLAERLGPRATIELLNRYFSRLGEPISEAGGFIDSYNGDEIMALFGVSADRAVAAGVGMWRALAEFNRDAAITGRPVLRMGMGLNTGRLVLGTVGGPTRIECGVVGDTVNVASRIEQLTKVYRAPFLIGEHTYDSLFAPERFSIRKVDRVAVKGKVGAIALYEVLDAESPERRAAKQATLAPLERAMDLYFERDFSGARDLLQDVVATDPEDAVAALFAGRAERYVAAPPPSDWQGFETLDHK